MERDAARAQPLRQGIHVNRHDCFDLLEPQLGERDDVVDTIEQLVPQRDAELVIF